MATEILVVDDEAAIAGLVEVYFNQRGLYRAQGADGFRRIGHSGASAH